MNAEEIRKKTASIIEKMTGHNWKDRSVYMLISIFASVSEISAQLAEINQTLIAMRRDEGGGE